MNPYPWIAGIVDLFGPLVDLLAVAAWGAVLYGYHAAGAHRRACKAAAAKNQPLPEPNLWIRHSRTFTTVACLLLWLACIRWGRIQQVPVRG